jgi:hypothetical protein
MVTQFAGPEFPPGPISRRKARARSRALRKRRRPAARHAQFGSVPSRASATLDDDEDDDSALTLALPRRPLAAAGD